MRLKEFLTFCIEAAGTPDACVCISGLFPSLLSDPALLTRDIEHLGQRISPNARSFHRSADLTILDITLEPGTRSLPHDHRMWIVAGAYRGVEDNIVYRLDGAELVEERRVVLRAPGVLALSADHIHSVANTGTEPFGSIQVCGGDFGAATPFRRQWNNGIVEPFRMPRP